MLTKFHLVKAMVFLVVMYECESWTIKAAEYWTVDLEKTIDCPFDSKEIKPVNPKGNQSWIFIGRTDAEAETPILWPPSFFGEELTHLKRPWCWERLKAGGEGDDRGWDGWMASPTWWTWVWVSSGSWWWTGKPGILQSMGSQIDTSEQLNKREQWTPGMHHPLATIISVWFTHIPPALNDSEADPRQYTMTLSFDELMRPWVDETMAS